MKKILLSFVLFLAVSSLLHAQLKRGLVFFNDENRNFTVWLNGVVQNPTPQVHVKITDLTSANYKVRVVFEDGKTAPLTISSSITAGYEAMYEIRKKNKKKYRIAFLGSTRLYDDSFYPKKIDTVVIKKEDVAVFEGFEAPSDCYDKNDHKKHEKYNDIISAEDFEKAKKTISAQNSEQQMFILKQIVKSNRFYTSQIIELAKLFLSDDKRLEVAKLAYDRAADPGNYYMFNEVLTFSSSKKALDEYMDSHKKEN